MGKTHFSNLNLKWTSGAGINGAGDITAAGVEVGDTLLTVAAVVIATGVIAEDITSRCTITAADTIASTDTSDYSTGHYIFVQYLDKDA